VRTKLYRRVGKHLRYYIVELYRSLFGEYVVERRYGNVANRSATGLRRDIFKDSEAAKNFFFHLLQRKQRKGYSL